MMVEHGMHMFPCYGIVDGACECGAAGCGSPGKHPRVSRWQEVATTDRDQLRRWAKQWPRANWGIATGTASGVVVLDVDPRHGGDETLVAHEAEHGDLSTWAVLTGGGGRHLYFRHPGFPVNNSAGVVGPGLDIRGDGGFVIAPGSRHISGRAYAISVDHHPDDVPLAEIPAWILAAIDRPTVAPRPGQPSAIAPRPAEEWRALVDAEVQEGTRNSRIASIAGHLLRRYVDPYMALYLLQSFNRDRCQPPLDDGEVSTIVTSIAKREMARRGAGRG